jgi:hypothetical protein
MCSSIVARQLLYKNLLTWRADPVSHLWSARDLSEDLLRKELPEEEAIISQLFDLADEVILNLDRQEGSAPRIASLALLKARRVALGIYAMTLACLGQEAGALVRPLQECWEFLTYLRQDPKRATEVIKKGKPRAGKIGKAIGSKFQAMRESLSESASHLSFSMESIGHLLDMDTLDLRTTLRITNKPSAPGLRRNMGVLFSLLLMTVGEALAQLEDTDSAAFAALGEKFQDLHQRGRRVFSLEKVLGEKYNSPVPPP